jgi:flagellar M-ring protein FliF
MNFLSSIVSQFVQVLAPQPAARKLLLLVVVGGSIAAMVWLMSRASTGGYVPVLTQSTISETGAAMTRLSQVGIPARTENNGASLVVARNRQDEAIMLLAEDGIFNRGATGNELLDRNSFGDSAFKQEKNYLRVREGELARTLMSLNEVESARVHLALPEEQLYARDEQPPKASVVLKLRNGAHLSERQISGIVNLVSHSVERLEPGNVSIIDSAGNILDSRPQAGYRNLSTENLGFKSTAEERLRTEIEKMLERTVGKDRVVASVQMDYDFSSQKSVETIYNPTEQDPITRTESTTIEQQNSTNTSAGDGSAGAANAIRPGAQRSDSTKDYAISQSITETSLSVPTLKRITVGVMVDGMYDETTAADGSVQRDFRTRTEQEMAELERVVKATIGFNNETRSDIVELSCVPFQFETPEMGEDSALTPELRKLIELVVQWTVVAVIGLLLILMVLKPAVKQITVTPLGGGGGGGYEYGSLPAGVGGGALALPGSHAAGGALEDRGEVDANVPLNAQQQRNQRLMHLAQSNKLTEQHSQQIHSEIQSEAQHNPHRAVSMIRQWMEEN